MKNLKTILTLVTRSMSAFFFETIFYKIAWFKSFMEPLKKRPSCQRGHIRGCKMGTKSSSMNYNYCN